MYLNNFDEENLLIGDEGFIYESLDINSWQLQDFITDMKSWANIIPQHKSGCQEVQKILLNQYQGLSQWLEFYLLHTNQLREILFSDPCLLNLKPHADLSAASHDFITRHFYPRLGFLWRDIASSHSHLWAFCQYSLFHQQVQDITKNEKRTKTKTLNTIQNTIIKNREWLDNTLWQLNTISQKQQLLASQNSAKTTSLERQNYLHKLKEDPISLEFRLKSISENANQMELESKNILRSA